MEEHLRLAYLKTMGITSWVPKELPDVALVEVPVSEHPRQSAPLSAATKTTSDASATQKVPDETVEPALGSDAGDAPWLDEAPPCLEELSPTVEIDDAPPDIFEKPEEGLSKLDWGQLQQRVAQCQLCELHKTRSQTVFGTGSQTADLMIIGEAPGAEEDKQGEPFVGRAGSLLNAMLLAMGFKRQQVYIANILKCRPPGNRDPHKDEEMHCHGYLQRQVELLQPKVILAVGRIAAQQLLASQDPLGRLRGQLYRYGNTPLVVTYHPAYLLRSPDQKGKAWQDLQKALKLLS